MKNFIQAFRDLREARDLKISKSNIVYFNNTNEWACFWFFDAKTLNRIKGAEIIC